MTKKVGFKICLMVLIVLLCLTAFIGCDNSSNDDYGDIIVDYEDAELFEKALNNGEDTIGKIVKFRIDYIAPDYYLGTNYWSGEHLNMVPRESLIYDVGNMATVRVIAVMKDNDSWIIDCTNVLKGELPESRQEFIEETTTVNENEIRKEFQRNVSYMLKGAEAFVTYDSIYNGKTVYSDDTVNPVAGRMISGHDDYEEYLSAIQNDIKTTAEQEFYDAYVIPLVDAIGQLEQELLNEDYIYYATDVLAQIVSYCNENNFDSISVVQEQLEEFANDASWLLEKQR